jgi:hypothetical protein
VVIERMQVPVYSQSQPFTAIETAGVFLAVAVMRVEFLASMVALAVFFVTAVGAAC